MFKKQPSPSEAFDLPQIAVSKVIRCRAAVYDGLSRQQLVRNAARLPTNNGISNRFHRYTKVSTVVGFGHRPGHLHHLHGAGDQAIITFVKLKTRRLAIVIGYLVVVFMALTLSPAGVADMYARARQAYARGEYETVEGPVSNFHPMPYSGHENESFL